jgi:phage tail-like protein
MRRYTKFVLALFLLGLMPLMTGAVDRAYVSGRYALELDGTVVGFLSSAEGGNPVGEVVTEQLGTDMVARKHIAGVKYEDITVSFGTGMSSRLYDWIRGALEGNYSRKSGSIIYLDYNNRELSRMTFSGALLSEVTLPALDASSKDAAKMTIKFQPEFTRQVQGDGGILRLPGQFAQKKWLPANFRLRIDGLDSAMSRVNKIEAITIKQKIIQDGIGEGRDYVNEPGGLEVPNLVFTTTEAYSQSLTSWRDDFVIRGNNGEDQEKTGTLEYLTPDLKNVLFSLTFHNLGIFRLTPDKLESGSPQVRRVKAELYMERVEFDYTSAAAQLPIPS